MIKMFDYEWLVGFLKQLININFAILRISIDFYLSIPVAYQHNIIIYLPICLVNYINIEFIHNTNNIILHDIYIIHTILLIDIFVIIANDFYFA
jgi:hypothetical protein